MIVIGIIINVLVVISILSVFFWVRNNYYNVFEGYYRLIGWMGLVIIWIFVVFGNVYDLKFGEWRLDVYFLIFI